MAEENKEVEDLETDEKLDENFLTIEKETVEASDSKKKSNLNKILFGLIGFLVFVLLIGIVLYFLDFFSPKEEPKPISAVQETSQEIEVKEEPYKFDIKDINSKKLNDQLSFLTNKNIPLEKQEELDKIQDEQDIIDEQKRREEEAIKAQEEELLKEKSAIEEKRIELENEKAQLEAMRQEALLLKQELESNKTKLEDNLEQENETKAPEEQATAPIEQKIIKEADTSSSFLKFINVAKIKGSLYKKYLDKVTQVDTNAILCRDDKNRIEIYFGPFNDNESRELLLNKLINAGFEEAFELELTQEEFDKRCNY